MNPKIRVVAVVFTAMITLSIVGPGLAVADSHTSTGNLAIDVVQNDEITVTVTDNGTGVANATANVTASDENVSYAGEGTYTTDENGSFGLPTPEEAVNVTITTTVDNQTVTTNETLDAASESGALTIDVSQSGEVTVTDNGTAVANATVNVTSADENVTYIGEGTYISDGNGTVVLPTPDETVNVTITATVDNRTLTTTATLTAEVVEEEPEEPFGIRVKSFIDSIIGDDDDGRSVGERVAGFVTSNNPGNPPAHAGPGTENETATDTDSANRSSSDSPGTQRQNGNADAQTGPPEHVESDGEAGPPEHAEASSTDDNDDADSSTQGTDSDGDSIDGSGNSASSSGGSSGSPGNSGASPGNGPPGR